MYIKSDADKIAPINDIKRNTTVHNEKPELRKNKRAFSYQLGFSRGPVDRTASGRTEEKGGKKGREKKKTTQARCWGGGGGISMQN